MAHIFLRNRSSLSNAAHSGLTGLDADDHTQYHNDTRAETWLTTAEHGDIVFDYMTATTLEFSGGGELVFSIPDDEFQLNKGLDITGGLTASTAIYGVDFSNVANTGHTHSLTDLEQGGASTNDAIVWDGANWIASAQTGGAGGGYVEGDDAIFTSVSADTITATTLVLYSGISYPNGVQKTDTLTALAGIGSTWSWTQAPATTIGPGFSYTYKQQAIVASGASPTTAQYGTGLWIVPDNWISGTPITLEYGFDISSNGGALQYMDLYFSAVSRTFNPDGDETNGYGREYITTRTETFSKTGCTVYGQTYKLETGLTLTSNGTAGSYPILPGDAINLLWYHQQSAFADPGLTSTVIKMVKLKINYWAEE